MELGKTLRTLFLPAVLLAAAACDRAPLAIITLAEFQDENPDGVAQQDESILVYLDRPLPVNFDAETVQAEIDPPVASTLRASIGQDRRRLRLRIIDGTPALQLKGVYGAGQTPNSSGLLLDLGDGVEQSIDLQNRIILPRLSRAIWIDANPEDGNAVVDGGDRIRLVFDQKVRLAEGFANNIPKVPQDIVLAKDQDRLGSEAVPAEMAPAASGDEHEIDIILGSDPVLEIAGKIAGGDRRVDRTGPDAPSGLAINGTHLLPMNRITALNGGPGVCSEREVDIELPDPASALAAGVRENFPGSVSRMFHSLTRFQDRFAIIAGGLDTTEKALDDVLLYNPIRNEPGSPAFKPVGKLPQPTWQHTATLLPGADRQEGTEDDMVVLCGGTDGQEVFSTIVVIFVSSQTSNLVIRKLPQSMKLARAEHAAVAVGKLSVLVDGGWHRHEGKTTDRLTESAELLRFERSGDEIRLAETSVFRSLARVRHSLNLLVPDSEGTSWVLAYGGYGRNRYLDPYVPILKNPDQPIDPFGEKLKGDEPESLFNPARASILSSPILINLETPRESITRLGIRPGYPLIRAGHLAAGLGSPNKAGVPEADSVIMLSGSLSHPVNGMDGDINSNWELPRQGTLEAITNPRKPPDGHESLNGILFTFDPSDPKRSRIESVRHPAPEPSRIFSREHAALCMVPGLGIIVSGGEPPPGASESGPHSSLEVYLAGREAQGQIRKIASRLPSPRSRHRSFLVEDEGKNRLLFVGGLHTGGADIEEIPLPTPRADE